MDDPLRIDRVESEKKVYAKEGHRGQERVPSLGPSPLPVLLIAFASFLAKASQTLQGKSPRLPRTLKKAKNIYDTLELFKRRLEKLKEEDHAADSHFSQELSELWNHLLEDFERMPSRDANKKKIAQLIEKVNAYPKGEERSLGFYLTHYAGDTWLPFPYLDLLKRLHRSYCAYGMNSDLIELLQTIQVVFD